MSRNNVIKSCGVCIGFIIGLAIAFFFAVNTRSLAMLGSTGLSNREVSQKIFDDICNPADVMEYLSEELF